MPFVALRPGAFVDQFGMWGGDGFAAGRVMSTGDSSVPNTWVYTPDLADNLAAAVDADISTSERIDIGWDRALSPRELATIAGRVLGRDLELVELDPAQIRFPGMSDEARTDLVAMFEYFRSGRYVADTRRQAEVFELSPSPKRRSGADSQPSGTSAERAGSTAGSSVDIAWLTAACDSDDDCSGQPGGKQANRSRVPGSGAGRRH